MAITAPAAVKKCVTCGYWGGARAASPTGRKVLYKLSASGGDAGICGNRSSTKNGRSFKGVDTGCPRWVKLSRLK